MIETLPVTPLSAALGAVIVELRLLGSRWPVEVERRTFDRAQVEVHRDVTHAILRLPLRRSSRRLPAPAVASIDEPTAKVLHEAYMSALVVAVMVLRFVRRAQRKRIEVPPVDRMSAAAAALLDALDPFVQRADVALRRVMLDGEPMQLVASSVAPPA